MMPVLQFFGLTLPVAPLFALLAFYLGSELGSRAIGWLAPKERREEEAAAFNNAVFFALVASLVAARLIYASRYLRLYLDDPGLLISLRPGTLALGPGAVVGAGVGLLYLYRKRVPVGRVADAAAYGLAGGLALFNVGRFLSGDAYGTLSYVPWAVRMWGLPRHPVQLYTALALVAILVLLWRYRHGALSGELFWRFVMLYGFSELFLDAFRANPATWALGIRPLQVMALAAVLVSMYILSHYARMRSQAGESAAALGEDARPATELQR